jgi:hypothetical protein
MTSSWLGSTQNEANTLFDENPSTRKIFLPENF